jgi:hypothetical protein
VYGGTDSGECVDNYGKYNDFDDCMYTKLYDISMEQVGCTVPWLPNKYNICRDPEKQKKAFDVYQDNRRNQHDICPNSCLFTNTRGSAAQISANHVVKKKV